MSASLTLIVDGREHSVQIEAGEVTTEDRHLQAELQFLLDRKAPKAGGWHPTPDQAAADVLMEHYDGRILEASDPPVEDVPGRVY